MKFSLVSDLDFEAENQDDALLKLALHFISQMNARPEFILNKNQTFDAFGVLIQNVPSLDHPTTDGYIDVDVHGDFLPPEMLQ